MTIETFLRDALDRMPAGSRDRQRRVLRDLVARRMNMTSAMCLAHPDVDIPHHIEVQLWRDVAALASGMPLGYVHGTTPFLNWEFLTDSRALCPRAETEELCDRVIRHLGKKDAPPSIVDLGCGSGVLGLSLALTFPGARVVLCDAEEAALELARENCARFGLTDRVSIVRSDWWADLDETLRFDLIISNPPYVAFGDDVESGVLRHEPHAALFAGTDGLDAIRRILRPLGDRIHSGGMAAFELGHLASGMLQPLLDEVSLLGRWWWESDQMGVRRYLFFKDLGKVSHG